MKKATRRKKRYARIDVLAFVLQGVRPATESDLDTLRVRELSSLEAFVQGRADLQEWKDMSDMLNLCETVAGTYNDGPTLEVCRQAQAALVSVAGRYQATGSMGLAGPSLQALRTLYAYHDAQRTQMTRGDYERFIAKTRDRIRSKAPGVVDISEVL